MDRRVIFPEAELPSGAALLAEGRALAREWTVGPSAFLRHVGHPSELDYKRAAMAERRVMQHAQIGYRDPAKSIGAYRRIWEDCDRRGVTVCRYGLCLDWSMALPRALRAGGMRGTGMILPGVEDFVALANAAPVAAHFGDFVLGFPGALENTQAALAAGATAIGNLGQYFTFRIPGHDDDITASSATVRALGLIAAQPVPVMVHSNIDDGYAAQFTDLANCLGQILIEQDIVGKLVGAPIGHAFGHHFSDPLSRLAFQRALAMSSPHPGTMIYGNTTSYRGTAAENYAGLSSYLLVDILGQMARPSGHSVNPVPVTENERIPEIEEVVEAQLFAGRLVEQASGWPPLVAEEPVVAMATELLEGARRFRQNVMAGLAVAGIDTDDAFAMLLALRRIGARRLERLYGAGAVDAAAAGGRKPLVPATILAEIDEMAEAALRDANGPARAGIGRAGLRLLVATSDVHEHGKMLIEEIARRLGVGIEDGGISTEPERLAALAGTIQPDAIAISTYNGVALRYYEALFRALSDAGLAIPILIGGRLNQIPEGSNTSMPVDVGEELAAAGAVVCREASDLLPALSRLASTR